MTTNDHTQTLFTTWVRLTGHTLDEDTNLDPDYALGLTDEAREALRERALEALTVQVDELLAPYGGSLLGNGDIIGPVSRVCDFDEALEDAYVLREELTSIDLTDVLEKFETEHIQGL